MDVSAEFPYGLTAHAARVIVERDISLGWVARVLSKPTRTECDRKEPALRHALAEIPENGGRVLRVVYNERTQPWLVITAYFDRAQRGKL
jgi:hypothetical protein